MIFPGFPGVPLFFPGFPGRVGTQDWDIASSFRTVHPNDQTTHSVFFRVNDFDGVKLTVYSIFAAASDFPHQNFIHKRTENDVTEMY